MSRALLRPFGVASIWPLALVGTAAAACGYGVTRADGSFALAVALSAGALGVILLVSRTRPTWVASEGGLGDDADRFPAAPRLAFFGGLLLLGQLSVRPIQSITAADYLFMLALGLTLYGLLATNQVRGLVPRGMIAGSALFALGALVTAAASDQGTSWIGTVVRLLYLVLVWTWIATIVLRRMRDIQIGTALWVISVAASGAAAVAQLVVGDVIPGTDLAFGRMTGTAQHVNDLGGSAAAALPAAIALALQATTSRVSVLIGISGAAIITTGLILSGSIGGMLGAAVGVTITAIASRRLRSLGLAVGLIAAAVITAMHVQETGGGGTLGERIAFVSGPSGTVGDRLDVFRLAWGRIAENPLIGAGIGVDPRASDSPLPDVVHSAFLSVWFHGGLLALLGLIVLVGTALRVGIQTVAEAQDSDERLLAASFLGSFSAYIAFGLGEPTLYVRYGWVAVALLLALRATQLRSRRTGRDRGS